MSVEVVLVMFTPTSGRLIVSTHSYLSPSEGTSGEKVRELLKMKAP